MDNEYGPERYTVKACGKRHGFCRVCRPDLFPNGHRAPKQEKPEQPRRRKYSGYTPHPTKTAWERHMETFGIGPRVSEPNEHGVRIDLGARGTHAQERPHKDSHVGTFRSTLKSIREQERNFTDAELRKLFKFSDEMIRTFRWQEKRLKLKREKKQAVQAQADNIKAKRVERERRIISMYLDESKTYQIIGDELGLSRERIRQILASAEKKYDIQIIAPNKGRYKKPKDTLQVAIRCRVCNKILEVDENKKDKWRIGFCKEHRLSKLAYDYFLQGARWWEMSTRERNNWRYHNDLRVKAVHKKATKNYRNKLKADPVKWAAFRAREDAYHKVWYAKKDEKIKAEKESERLAKIRPFIEVPDNDD